MIEKAYRSIKRFFSFGDDVDELLLERYAVSQRQIPLMYIILSINMVMLCVTHYNAAPAYLTLYMPGVMIAIGVIRIISWVRVNKKDITPERALKKLKYTLLLILLLSVVYIGWALSLFGYGDAYLKGQVTFFIGVTISTVITCLMPIRQVAGIILTFVVMPSAIFLLLQPETIFQAIAINMILVAGAMAAVLSKSEIHFHGSVTKQIELDRINRTVQRIADHDPLTDLANRRSFFENLENKIGGRHSDQLLGLVVIDLDGFKPVNDVFGHPAGDAVLCAVADCLLHTLPPHTCISRLGGDEFAFLILANAEQEIVEYAQDALMAISQPIPLKEGVASVTATAGIAICPDDANEPELLFERADYALCYAKDKSPGSTLVFRLEHEDYIRSASMMAQSLKEADLEAEMFMMFQPIVDANSKQIAAFEALARWNSPKLGSVSPEIFIGAAEQAGLVTALSEVLLRKALATAIKWPPNISLHFNLSAVDICSPEAIKRLISTVAASGFPSRSIVFEITETAILRDRGRALRSLKLLKQEGFAIALDDFGAGNSSLGYLKDLSFDILKIDRSFIQNAVEDSVSKHIVSSLISLCDRIGIGSVAEGVETREQLNLLLEMGCNELQGFYFCRPLPSNDTAAMFQPTMIEAYKSGT